MSMLKGIVPPLLTPFHSDGTLDLVGLDNLVDHLLNAGVHGIFALGSSGQVAYLTDAQRTSVVERVATRVAGRVPVMVGTADLTASRVVDQAKRVIDAGADAIVATAPFYALNSTTEVAEHYRMIAQAVDVPVI
ncbi:MAG: dihydrodipicolinate synthase family protein, partial [Propionibacteriaceae bacterium]|nr:dihydrodipicolinate synthase family protein [Propionibacteriaceae bacterium]